MQKKLKLSCNNVIIVNCISDYVVFTWWNPYKTLEDPTDL